MGRPSPDAARRGPRYRRQCRRVAFEQPRSKILEERPGDPHRRRRRRAGPRDPPGARERAQRRDPDGLVEHLPVERDGAGSGLALRARERRDHRASARHLLGGRSEGLVQRGQLRRVDRPLAVEAELARARHGGAERGVGLDTEVGAVDRLQAVRAGRQKQQLLGRAPAVEVGAAPAAERPSDAARSA